jgi:hypothetical protein
MIQGHYPNTYVSYDKNMDVSKYLGIMKHKSMVENMDIPKLNQTKPKQKIR